MKTQKKKRIEFIVFLAQIVVISIGMAMFMKWKQTGSAFVPETVLVSIIIFTLSVSLGLLARNLFKKFETYTRQQVKKKIIPALLYFYISSLVLAHLIITVGVFFWYIKKGHDLSYFVHNLFTLELKGVTGKILGPLLIATLVLFYILWRKSINREIKLEEEKLKFQYKTLKNQVNPHFLFNSLNTLSSLISTDTKLADTFVEKLAGVYRYIIDNEETEFVSLNEEIAFVESYFELQKIRDNGKIDLKISIDKNNSHKILPVSLQTLIENALKHNMATREKPLSIKISEDSGYIVAENNIQEKTDLNDSTGTGLQNLSDRVKLQTSKEVIINKSKNTFSVKIPLN